MPSKKAAEKHPFKRAVILAGGQGTRLRPYTTLLPKALVPLDDMPVLELVLRQLKHYGFTDITLTVGHLAELLEAYFGNGERLGVRITYAREDQPLGTSGPLKKLHDLPEHFLVMNADIVSDIDYRALFEAHLSCEKPLATLATYQRTSKIDFGIIEYDAKTCQVEAFVEKPTLFHNVCMGINVFSREILSHIPDDTFFGFDMLVKSLLEKQAPFQTFPFDGYWLDIGRVDDYETAVNDFQKMKSQLLPK
ncbi:MAG: nucleotidyltransferase family protein [Vampirovibrionales bacterium]|nr:nucleotidyltransferase family protein [Vampirovibrionales bacterium]